MHDKADVFIQCDNENVLFVKVPSKSEAEFLHFQMIPEIIVAITMDEYNSIPSKIEFLIPPPTPEITNARDGFEQSGKTARIHHALYTHYRITFLRSARPTGIHKHFQSEKE